MSIHLFIVIYCIEQLYGVCEQYISCMVCVNSISVVWCV